MLFDIGPKEDSGSKRSRRKPEVAKEPVVEAASAPVVHYVAQKPLGVVDEAFECLDARCRASIHDIVEEIDGRWLIECVFCGTGQWVRAIKGHLKPQFAFPSGDYAGRRIDEVAATPRGMAYVEWAASEHKSEAVRAACQKHLDSMRPAE